MQERHHITYNTHSSQSVTLAFQVIRIGMPIYKTRDKIPAFLGVYHRQRVFSAKTTCTAFIFQTF